MKGILDFMVQVKADSKTGQALIWEFDHCNKGATLAEAYTRASDAKIASFEKILRRAWETDGFNRDLKVTSRNTSFYSTMYSFSDEDGTYLVKDTKSKTLVVKVA